MSVPKYTLAHRLKDPAQSFEQNKNSKIRFSSKNPFDLFLWDSKRKIPYALELKTKSGKSVSFERTKEDKGDIHYHQIKGLLEWSKYDGMIAGLVIEFREIKTTVFLPINSFINIINRVSKKSINYNDIEQSGELYFIIPQKKKIKRYKYDVEEFLAFVYYNIKKIGG
jgi:penicillin-binding protein-related factor A (putative recombinase)